MYKILYISFYILIACNSKSSNIKPPKTIKQQVIKTSDYELIKVKNQQGLLILFPCFPCDANHTLSEFDIVDIATENEFSVLALNFNHRLFLPENEQKTLAELIQSALVKHDLRKGKVFIGGFSSGGNIALLITDYLIQSNSQIQPEGVFVVDAPVDLAALYRTAQKNLLKRTSENSIKESQMIIEILEKDLGNPKENINLYEQYSPYTHQSQNTQNFQGLEKIKIRLYTEPDLSWWQNYAQNDYEDLNAYYLEKLNHQLKSKFKPENIELIKTMNKGFRKNGTRHPHSWSIVNAEDLMKWMSNEIHLVHFNYSK